MSKYGLKNVENSISKHLNFNIFLGGGGGHAPTLMWGHLLQNVLTALQSFVMPFSTDNRSNAMANLCCEKVILYKTVIFKMV